MPRQVARAESGDRARCDGTAAAAVPDAVRTAGWLEVPAAGEPVGGHLTVAVAAAVGAGAGAGRRERRRMEG